MDHCTCPRADCDRMVEVSQRVADPERFEMTEVLKRDRSPRPACSADGKVIKYPDHDSVRKQSMTYGSAGGADRLALD